MALSDLQIFSEKLYGSYLELLSYNLELFNSATQGGLVLSSGAMQGDFSTETLWTRIPNLVRRRNPYTPATALTKTKLGMAAMSKVKVAGGTNPVELDKYQFSWILKSPEEAAAKMSQQLAEDSMADMVGTAIKTFVAAVGAQATNLHDGTAGVASLGGLVTAASKLGDRSDSINCWLMHSKSMFDIWGASLANASQLFNFGNIKVLTDGFGRPFVVSDNPALSYVSSGTKYRILGLTDGAVTVENNLADFNSAIVDGVGTENITRTFQAEWAWNLSLKGFTWDIANGGAAPSDAALATATNWDKVATSHKDLAGVLANFQ